MESNKKVKRRGVRLNKPQDVRRLLSSLINDAIAADEPDTDLLRAITYACSMILKTIEIGEMSDRLDRIERKLSL